MPRPALSFGWRFWRVSLTTAARRRRRDIADWRGRSWPARKVHLAE